MDYQEHLRRLAVHDDAFVGLLLGDENARSHRSSRKQPRSCASLPRSPSMLLLPRSSTPSPSPSRPGNERRDRRYPRGGDAGDRGRASRLSAPKLALALGYDVEEALERPICDDHVN